MQYNKPFSYSLFFKVETGENETLKVAAMRQILSEQWQHQVTAPEVDCR